MKYYLADNGMSTGPYTPQELMARGLHAGSLVWNAAMSDWKRAGDVPDLASWLNIGHAQTGLPPSPTPPSTTTVPPVLTPSAPQQAAGYAQPQYLQPATRPMPKTWNTEAIILLIVNVLLCLNILALIPAIVALVYGGNVKSYHLRGDYAGAQRNSSTAKTWAIVSLAITVISVILSIVMIVAYGGIMLALEDLM